MLKQPDAADFIKAMMKETADHESRDHWTVIPTASLDVKHERTKKFASKPEGLRQENPNILGPVL